jgi:hypothetical protein
LLTDDYTRPSGIYTRNFIGQYREAPSVFKRKGKYYMITSGCTGWDPNRALYATADSMLGSWTLCDNPCTGKGSDSTFMAQSTFVFQTVKEPDILIAMFDRWNKTDLVHSGYIWLPVTFHNEKMVIEWKDPFSFR